MLKEANQAYAEILNVLRKHKDVCIFNVEDLKYKAKCHLFGLELKEKYGLNINPTDIHSLDHNTFGNHITILWMGQKYSRTVSWEDDGKQPEDELLMEFRFPTGAYIFSEDYPHEIFQEFFLELKSYNPKYVDSHNHCLYFSIDTAKEVFNNFDDIFKKYHKKSKVYLAKQRKRQLEKELAELEIEEDDE